jgi:hypothetical protein
MASLTKKQRAALPEGLPLSAHDKLLEKFGIIALFHLVHPDGDREKIDPLRQFADCQVNLIAQTDLYEAFDDAFEDENEQERILALLKAFVADHAADLKLTALRNMDDVIGQKKWDDDLVAFCAKFEQDHPKAYKINMLGFAQNTDVTLFKDVSGAIANWTVDYNSPVYADEDIGKPKGEITIWPRRPELKKDASVLARAYTNARLLEHTSEEYQKTPYEQQLRAWNDIADQTHALITRVVDTVPQKNGPDVEVGSLFLEVLAWFIVSFREDRHLTVNIRRRAMTPFGETVQDEEVEEENQRGDIAEIDKTYRIDEVLTFVARPIKNGRDFQLLDKWPATIGDLTAGFIEMISYFHVGQPGEGLDSADRATYKATVMTSSPFLLMLPTLVAHKPHPGLVTGRNSPKWSLYEDVSPSHQKLNVTRTAFQGFTLGKYNPDVKQASIADLKTYGLELAYAHDHADTREYSFAENKKCMTLRKASLDCSPRHLVMASANEAIHHARYLMELQEKADKTGAVVGGYGCRIKNMVLNVTDRETGDRLSAIGQSNTRLKAYDEAMPHNGVFSALAK